MDNCINNFCYRLFVWILERIKIKMKMIEKVAKALCEEEHDDKANWTKYVDRAKVAIGAMKEPSEKILEAMLAPNGREDDGCARNATNKDKFNAAIDAALKDE